MATSVSESTKDIVGAIREIKANQKALADRMDSMSKPNRRYSPGEVFGAPHARRGEDPLSSRGYSFLKLFGAMAGILPKHEAKLELELHNRVHKAYCDGTQYAKAEPNSYMAPVAAEYLAEIGGNSLGDEVRQVTKAGVYGADPEEVAHYRQKYWGNQKALSWIDETLGGALVSPPMQGELIELLRNNEALLQAGARDVGMPPNGRITFPRQTGAATSYWVGESTTITDSQPTTGDLILTAKKLAVLVKIPNELFRFSSISVEQFVRDDIARVMALRLDKSLLEAAGSSVEPKGLITYSGIQTLAATTVGANGDTFQPQDVLRMIAAVEERNATFRGFIMRPILWSAIAARRADAVAAGDQSGPFVFNLIREMGTGMNMARGKSGFLGGYPVVKSTQISALRAKGAATNLTYLLGGDFSDYIIALGGVIEFVTSVQGDTPIAQDQTWVRGIQYADAGPRHEASFVFMDSLKQS